MSAPAARDVRLHVEAMGEGPGVVLGHGFGGSARNFRPQLRALRDGFRAVAFDARGHARSDAPVDAAAYTPDALAEDLGRVLDGSAGGCGVVGGLSMGAAIALHFARTRPGRARGLVLASFPASDGGVAVRAEEFADAIEREGLEAAGARFVWGPRSGLDAQGAALVRQGFLEHPPHALAHLLRGVIGVLPSAAALAPELTAFRVPALLVAGAEDPGSLAASRELAAALPRARLVVIEDAGHVVNLARPREFEAALRKFLEGL